MRSRHHLWITWGLCAALIAVLAGMAVPFSNIRFAQAQGENLLQNGGFEGEYIAVGGDPSRQVAPNWQPWNMPPAEGQSSSENLPPDYQPAPADRVLSGEAAQEYNTFFATHDAGVYQRVPVQAGAELRFSVNIYVWSAANFENPDVSNEPQDVNVQVGIDPTGGQDGSSEAIVWSDPVQYYDEYRELSINATAQGNAVTVFVRTNPQGAVGVNTVYVDDASLIQVGQGEVEAVETAEPDAVAPAGTEEASMDGMEATAMPDDAAMDATAEAEMMGTVEAEEESETEAAPALTDRLTYTVQAGDTVLAIANAYGSTVEAIIEANGLNESGFINVGQELVIPVVEGAEEALGEAMAEATMDATEATALTAPNMDSTAEAMTAEGIGGGMGETNVTPGMGGSSATGMHTVQPGETLYQIARRYHTTVEALATLNNLTNANLIHVGMQLHVPGAGQPQPPMPTPGQPGGRTHVVQVGDNAYRISLRYGITVEALAAANNLSNPNLLYLGQVLVIP